MIQLKLLTEDNAPVGAFKGPNATSQAVLQPIRLGPLTLTNRAVVAPLSRVSTRGDGVPTANMVRYYREFADGGFGLLISEGTYTDSHYAQGYVKQPGLVNHAQQRGWQQVVDAVHAAGSKMVLQLMHAGALSQHLAVTAGPSAVQPLRKKMPAYGGTGPFPLPVAMTRADIERTLDGFVATALRAKTTGFDGVEIHAANGYLLDQFLTDYTNRRQDNYGGAVANRIRLTTDIIRAVKAATGPDFYVGVRLSQGKVNDFDYLWPGGAADAEVIFPAVKQAGADAIHFASEGMGFEHGCLTADGQSLPRLARQLTGLPVIANGGMHDPALAARILAQGHGDLVSLGKGAIASPDWPQRLAAGKPVREFDAAVFDQGVTIEAAWEWRDQQAA